VEHGKVHPFSLIPETPLNVTFSSAQGRILITTFWHSPRKSVATTCVFSFLLTMTQLERIGKEAHNATGHIPNSMEPSSSTTTQELDNISWTLQVHYCVHKSLPMVPILSQINPVHTISYRHSKIHLNIIHSPTSGPSCWSLSFLISHQSPYTRSSFHPYYMACHSSS
jgi:hypothetical protein